MPCRGSAVEATAPARRPRRPDGLGSAFSGELSMAAGGGQAIGRRRSRDLSRRQCLTGSRSAAWCRTGSSAPGVGQAGSRCAVGGWGEGGDRQPKRLETNTCTNHRFNHKCICKHMEPQMQTYTYAHTSSHITVHIQMHMHMATRTLYKRGDTH